MDVVLDQDNRRRQLEEDVRDGLTRTPKSLPPKYFYDARGSELFDRITQLQEYYPTRREREILEQKAMLIAERSGAETLIELGSGTSEKTRLLLEAFDRHGSLREFAPFDVDPSVLAAATDVLRLEFPGLQITPIVGDFERHLDQLPRQGRRLIAFLGSTIGNLLPGDRARFFGSIRDLLGNDGALLLGTDLVKDRNRLLAAYDDHEGVTAAFNKNVLAVLNRELGADFDLSAFDHVVVWDQDQEWIEMRLRSRTSQAVRIAALDLVVQLAEGEEIRTEVSAKFRKAKLTSEVEAAGLRIDEWWTYAREDFALSIIRPGSTLRSTGE